VPAPVDERDALRRENIELRALLASVGTAVPATGAAELVRARRRRRWIARAAQLGILLAGIAFGTWYGRLATTDLTNGVRDGWNQGAGAAPQTRSP
jgi:hypothetical protein